MGFRNPKGPEGEGGDLEEQVGGHVELHEVGQVGEGVGVDGGEGAGGEEDPLQVPKPRGLQRLDIQLGKLKVK